MQILMFTSITVKGERCIRTGEQSHTRPLWVILCLTALTLLPSQEMGLLGYVFRNPGPG